MQGSGVRKNYFDDDVAARYDETSGSMFDADVSVQQSTCWPSSPVTARRSSLPLAPAGSHCHSPLVVCPYRGSSSPHAMAAQLLAKDGAQHIELTMGDMTTTRVGGSFRLVYLVYNTIGNLTTQDEQVACFANAAAHLEPGGCFVIEVGVPDLRRLPPGEDARVFSHAPGYVGYDRYIDLVAQQAMSHHFVADGSGVTRGQDAVPVRMAVRARPDGPARRHVAA